LKSSKRRLDGFLAFMIKSRRSSAVSEVAPHFWMKVSIVLLNLASVSLAGGLPRTSAQACCHFSRPAPEVRMFAFVNLAAASKFFNSIKS
jgi:hypothetical protein